MYAIETRALTKAYGGRRVVDNLNLHVRTGDIYGFVGKNGAGKSTVMKMIDSLVTPDLETSCCSTARLKLCRRRPARKPLLEAPL